MRRIIQKENSSGYSRYYYANWPLSEINSIQHHYSMHTDVLDFPRHGHGIKGAHLCMAIRELSTSNPFTFALTPDFLQIIRNPAVKWGEIEPDILEEIRKQYGDFILVRQSLITRMVLAIRRLFVQKD